MQASTQVLSPSPRLRLKINNATLYLLVVLGFILMCAINYQSNAAYIVVSLVISTAVVSVIHAYFNVKNLRITAGNAYPAFAGEPLRATVMLSAGSRASIAVVCDVPEIAEDDGVTTEQLPAGQSHTLTLVLPGRQRGVHHLRRLRVASLYPMGLVYVQSEIIIDWQFIVYPKPLLGGEQTADTGEGQEDGYRLGATGDFHGHRPYQAGESQRRVDWRAVARGRPVLVKEFVSGSAHDCWIDFDRYPGVPLEQRLSLMGGQIITAVRAARRYG
jgi:uncharacterized protein (DUF58 family)